MTPDEVVKELEILNQLTNIEWYGKEREAIRSAISLLQDYQKLRERVNSIDLPVKELGKIVMFIRHSMFLPENDKLSELNKMIREAIVTYLQQPTEH
jgi:hypothetical protein